MSTFSPRKRLRSFVHTFRGAGTLLSTQPNAWIHAAATIVAIVMGFGFAISRVDWALVAFAIALVWIAESLNTAIEFLADEVTAARNEGIRNAKDVAAFGVLVSALASTVIGLIVFLPHLLRLK